LGYHGRVGAFEVWQLDEQDYQWILQDIDEHALRDRIMEKGHEPLLTDALKKAHEGVTTLDELRSLGNILAPKPESVPWAKEPAGA
jgi:general secretion pathway protein E